MSTILDIHLKDEGYRRILWAERHMPVLGAISERFAEEKPFEGLNMSLAIHLEAKTASLVRAFVRGGANIRVTGSNPQSTQDAVCAALVADGCEVFAIHGESRERYLDFWQETLSVEPHLVIDDGADLINLLLGERQDLATNIIGACEETTSGVQRLRAWQEEGRLLFPVIAVNDALCKTWFDNLYGTGQSVWDGLMRTTNLLIAGKKVVIAGYGWCSQGIARYAAGLGAQVIVTEIDPIKALRAVMDGHTVSTMDQASEIGDIFITATAGDHVLGERHFRKMKHDAIICNAGHFNREIDIDALDRLAVEKTELRKNIMAYKMADGRELHLIAHGALVNIAAGDGHPIEIMDLSFSLQALSAEYLAKNRDLKPAVYRVPDAIDREVAALKLRSLGYQSDADRPMV